MSPVNMLPVVGFFLGPFAVYEAVLASRVILIRRGHRISLATEMRDKGDNKGPDPLTVALRCHGNFIEGVPLALLIGGIAELNGANKTALALSLFALFISRILHAENGLRRHQYAAGSGRAIGTMVTQGFIVIWGLICSYMALMSSL